MTQDRLSQALLSGLAGAAAMTVLHESLRRVMPDAPRLDLLGMRALARARSAAGAEPAPESLHGQALVMDLASNAAYFSLAGAAGPDDSPWLGKLLGIGAGFGSLYLPGMMGLGTEPTRRTPETEAMTVGIYAVGGMVAGLVFRALAHHSE